ncbi:DUF932 domain-containing protein [Mucilaginibacter sp.]|uniref:DUF932 domain-containing protein n=1 Tax=Mucilaginibacter sp. TaxID=1882438 RepID=UPI0035BBCFE1
MAHNINLNEKTGKHSFMSKDVAPWHGLGQIVTEYPTSSEAMQFAGLDFIVDKRPLFTTDTQNFLGDDEHDIIIPELQVPNFFATVRADTDQVLGVVGNDYEVVQNRDAFTFFDSIVGGDGIMYETAGALGNGEKIFITAKLPGYIQVGRNDLIEKYLFLTTTHDGSGSIVAAFTPVRIVCQNTLNAALGNLSNVIRIRHTQSAVENLKKAHKTLEISNKLSTELEGIFNRWAKVKVTDKQLLKLVEQAMAPSKEALQYVLADERENFSSVFKNKCEKIAEYAFGDETQQTVTTKGTLFGAYNAITGYYQNVKTYRNQEAKLKNIMFGGGQVKSQTAFDLCLAHEKDGVLSLN